jgi:ABC-type branched-subunit amino acid transport system substrate-binding protein
MRHIRRILPAVATLAVALAGCSVSSSDDDAATSDSAAETVATSDAVTTEPADSTPAADTTDAPDTVPATETTEPAVLARGVTDDTIKIGSAFIDVDAVREQFGIELGDTPEEMVPALIAGLNADGGINGRQVELVQRLVVPVGTESSEQACRELIEDEGVFAVVGTFLGDTGLCVTETYATPYFGGFGLTPERQERSQAPFLTTASNEADALGESVDYLVDNGQLEGKKVAVYSEAAGYSPELIDTYMVSKLEAAGVEVVANTQLTDTGGDLVAAGAELDRILQSFEAAGADTVLVAGGMIAFAPALERTDYAPQLIILNGQILAPDAVEGFAMTNPDELIGALGVIEGVLPSEIQDDPLLAECIEWINENSDLAVTPQDLLTVDEAPESRDYRNLPALCGLFQLMRTVLTEAGDNPSAESILATLDGLSSFPVVGNPDASLSAERWGAGAPIRLWEYDQEQVRFLPVS